MQITKKYNHSLKRFLTSKRLWIVIGWVLVYYLLQPDRSWELSLAQTILQTDNWNIPFACVNERPRPHANAKWVNEMAENEGALQGLFAIPSQGLMFCSIEKAASTRWRMLLKLLSENGTHVPCINDKRSILHEKLEKGECPDFHVWFHENKLASRSIEERREILQLSNLTWVVFVRDPRSRFLSTYLDSNVYGFEGDKSPRHFQSLKLDKIQIEGEVMQANLHFRHQSSFCGLDSLQFDYIGRFERMASDSKEILTKLGLWKRFGRQGWGNAPFESFPGNENSKTHEILGKYYDLNMWMQVSRFYMQDLIRFRYPLYEMTQK